MGYMDIFKVGHMRHNQNMVYVPIRGHGHQSININHENPNGNLTQTQLRTTLM